MLVFIVLKNTIIAKYKKWKGGILMLKAVNRVAKSEIRSIITDERCGDTCIFCDEPRDMCTKCDEELCGLPKDWD